MFEDGSEEITSVSMQHKNQVIPKTFKESYISHMLKKPYGKRPTWFIGSEEEFLKSCEFRRGLLSDDNKKFASDTAKNCSKITVSSQVAILPVVAGRATGAEKRSEKPTPLTIGKHKKIIEPSITPVCTPTSECEECFKNSQILPAPSLERLLPIGSNRSAGKSLPCCFYTYIGKIFYQDFSSNSPESPLSKMDLMLTGNFAVQINSMFIRLCCFFIILYVCICVYI